MEEGTLTALNRINNFFDAARGQKSHMDLLA